MSFLRVTAVSGRAVEQIQQIQVPTGIHSTVRKLLNYLESLGSGGELANPRDDGDSEPPAMMIECLDAMGTASGTFTLTGVIATDAVSVNGVTFTAVASGATGNQFNIGGSDADTAQNLAEAISNSASDLIQDYVSTSADGSVVTIYSETDGIAGNTITIASADATIVASGARLTGGAEDPNGLMLEF